MLTLQELNVNVTTWLDATNPTIMHRYKAYCGGRNILFLPNQRSMIPLRPRLGPLALSKARSYALALALACTFSSSLAFAQSVKLPPEAPIPALRPFLPLPLGAASTAASPAFGNLLNPAPKHLSLKNGIEALSARQIGEAREARNGLAQGALDRQILTWAIALSDDPSISSAEITEAMHNLRGWPVQAQLEAAWERALSRENPLPEKVIAAYAQTPPTTFEGLLMLGRAYLANNKTNAARTILTPYWRTQKLDETQETLFINEFGSLLSAEDHRFRMERMLHADRIRSATRIAPLANAVEFAEAWAAIIRNDPRAPTLLAAVPEAQRSAEWTFLQARQLRRSGNYIEAAKVMLSIDPAASAKIDSDSWWTERRVLSRELLDIKQEELAYKIVAAQTGGNAATLADAAFHAGWYALRFMDDPVTSTTHFTQIAAIADGPISLARANYWLGRAADAGAPDLSAADYYAKAAQYSTTFYGQLAAAKLKKSKLNSLTSSPSSTSQQKFANLEPVQAIRRLEEQGYKQRAATLYHSLAREIDTADELAELVTMAEQQGEHYLALRLAKTGASRGLAVGSLTHPLGAIPADTALSGAGAALAYAIARQESEFNISAVSGAGARGLLQLMPATAEQMAKKSGLPFSALRLTSDPGYNATLGAAYLDDQLARFEGSYILTFIGYNAGPRRVSEWIERYGDPRGKPVEDVIDWIERIPFPETRGYVQRVLENYQVYKMQLTGHFNIEQDLIHGR